MKAIEWKEQKEGDRKRKHADGDKKPAAGKGTQKPTSELTNLDSQNAQYHTGWY